MNVKYIELKSLLKPRNLLNYRVVFFSIFFFHWMTAYEIGFYVLTLYGTLYFINLRINQIIQYLIDIYMYVVYCCINQIIHILYSTKKVTFNFQIRDLPNHPHQGVILLGERPAHYLGFQSSNWTVVGHKKIYTVPLVTQIGIIFWTEINWICFTISFTCLLDKIA